MRQDWSDGVIFIGRGELDTAAADLDTLRDQLTGVQG